MDFKLKDRQCRTFSVILAIQWSTQTFSCFKFAPHNCLLALSYQQYLTGMSHLKKLIFCSITFTIDFYEFILNFLGRFHVMEFLSLNPRTKSSFLEGEQESSMLESCLTFLASLMSIRTNIGKCFRLK